METSKEKPIIFDCLKIEQPIGSFFIGVMDYDDIIKISYSDIRRLDRGDDNREVESYTGIQRPLSQKRVKEIGKYVNLLDATFPTSVILHIDSSHVEYDEANKVMILPYQDNIAKVLDGQHRVSGLEFYDRKNDKDFQLSVTIFIDMELEDQAIVFATVNKTQTKVNKSLVADLFGFAKYKSPQKTCHNVIRALNRNDSSPFKDKIKILGVANDKTKETITQAAFSENLMTLITKDRMDDRNIYRGGGIPPRYFGNDLEKCPFRNLFIDDNDLLIAKNMKEYFLAVQEKWQSAWDENQPEMILNKTTGFNALMRFFRTAYNSSGRVGEVVEKDYYLELFKKTSLEAKDFTRSNFIPGSSGTAKLYNQLIEECGLS